MGKDFRKGFASLTIACQCGDFEIWMQREETNNFFASVP
jgi:hypothetical protein